MRGNLIRGSIEMRRVNFFLSAVSAAAIAAATASHAQKSFPSIDIGKPKKVTRTAAKTKPAPHTGRSGSRGGGNSRRSRAARPL